jgi:DNA processing protein
VRSLDDSAALVVLLRAGAHPWQRYAELVEAAGSARAVLDAEREQPSDLFAAAAQADSAAEAARRRAGLRTAREQIERWGSEGMRLLTVLDPDYPPNLRTVHDRPPLVFLAGSLEPRDARSIAVVGAREATRQGTASAAVISEHLVDAGYTVVSGLAAGIDTAAHSAALARGGRTIAVVGTGLRRVYPPQNASLQRRILERGAVISQFWPDAPPSRRSFPMRNAVMSGLTLASVVVEAAQTSGSRIQARLALAHGRPVFLLESLLRHPWARDFARMPGVHVVGSPTEISAIVERLNSSGALVP